MLVTCDTSPLLSEEVFEQCYLILFPDQVTSTISKRDYVQEAGKTEVMGTLCCRALPGHGLYSFIPFVQGTSPIPV